MNLSPQAKQILNNAADRYTLYLNRIIHAVEQLPSEPEVQGNYVLLPLDKYQELLTARDFKPAA